MKQPLLLILFVITIGHSQLLANAWVQEYKDFGAPIDMVQDTTGEIYLYGIRKDLTSLPAVFLKKFDALGTEQWTKIYYPVAGDSFYAHKGGSLILTEDRKLVFVASQFRPVGGSGTSIDIFSTDLNGNLLQNYQIPFTVTTNANTIVECDGGYALSYFTINDTIGIIRLDDQFNEVWRFGHVEGVNPIESPGTDLAYKDSVLYLAGAYKSDSLLTVTRMTLSGGLDWRYVYGFAENVQEPNIIVAADNNVHVALTTTETFGPGSWKWKVIIQEFSPMGTALTLHENAAFVGSNVSSFEQKPDSGFVIFSLNVHTGSGCTATGACVSTVVETDKNWQITRARNYDVADRRQEAQYNVVGIYTIDKGYCLSGWLREKPVFIAADLFILKTDSNGILLPARVFGGVFHDADTNCYRNNQEPGLRRWMVELRDTINDVKYYSYTDERGMYVVNLPHSTFELSLHRNNPYWEESCDTTLFLTIDSSHSSVKHNIGVKPVVFCPLLQVYASIGELRVCSSGSGTIQFCNLGTETAYDPYMDVTFDDHFIVDSFSMPYDTMIDSTTFRFSFDSLVMDTCVEIMLYFNIPCQFQLTGFSQCIEIHAHPDSICITDTNWDQSQLFVSGRCENDDTVAFKVANIGKGGMGLGGVLHIIEDDLLVASDTVTIPARDSAIYKYKATGKTMSLIAFQTPNNPFDRYASDFVDNCGAAPSPGFTNTFSVNTGLPYLEKKCRLITNSFDPNDKTGFPFGYGNEHYIQEDETINYLIRFQNTGTAPAIDIEILDTLSPLLDMTTFVAGASSHPYSLSITNSNILSFAFDNIYLPDSHSNEPASHGYIEFTIKPVPGLAPGSRIENSASIYFDINPPVLTNTTWHTIGDFNLYMVKWEDADSSQLSTSLHYHEQDRLNIFPNPFTDQFTLDVGTIDDYDLLQIMVSDLEGNVVLNNFYNEGSEFTINNPGLRNGMYMLHVFADGKLIGYGKIIRL